MTTTQPPACAFAQLQYLPGTGLILVDSGNPQAILEYNIITYSWSGSNWTLITSSPTGSSTPIPTLRVNYGSAYDTTSSKLVLFGGKGLPGLEPSNQVDSFNGTTWSNTIANYSSTGPSVRYKPMMAAVSTGAYMWGGLDLHYYMLNDFWLLASGVWTQLSTAGLPNVGTGVGPSVRYDASFASNAAGGAGNQVVMFGGANFGQMLNDLWVYTVGTGWALTAVSGTVPSCRAGASLCWVQSTGTWLLFGGRDSSGRTLGDTWSLASNFSAWTLLTPTITPLSGTSELWYRDGAMLASDGSTNTILFGGRTQNGTVLNDTWKWSGTAWVQQ
jgi:Galactose oxidase, central domain